MSNSSAPDHAAPWEPKEARHRRLLLEIGSAGFVERIVDDFGQRHPALLIDNEWVTARSGETAETFDPSTESMIGHYAIASADDVDRAVRAAETAQVGWAALTMDERAQYIARLADAIEDNGALLATADALNAGLPVARMLNDIDQLARVLRAWPGMAMALRGDVLEGTPGLHYTRHHPYGVVARIVAFNHPILFAVKGSLAALLAGNTVVLKPADQTPLSALLLGDIVQRVFPPGVFNVVTGDGKTGAAMVTHPAVRRVAFTGSVGTGRLIQETAAKDRIRNVSLELGGKNAMIVFPDVSIPDAARNAVFGMNLWANGGQSCGSTSRLLVHEDIQQEFVDELAALLEATRIGPAYRTDIDMGPVISHAAATRIRNYIASGTDEGAKLVTGGLDDARVPDQGHFVAPTLFTDVPPSARIAREEIFGPVISLMTWSDLETAIAAANDSELGLSASVWTNDLSTALTTADRLEAGYVWINESTTHYFGMPFGGWKDSGIGREESLEELWDYLQLKSINVKLPESPV
jgi:acyl-CoA reductase-like NAD-dependent aldehyde dehydrogenase